MADVPVLTKIDLEEAMVADARDEVIGWFGLLLEDSRDMHDIEMIESRPYVFNSDQLSGRCACGTTIEGYNPINFLQRYKDHILTFTKNLLELPHVWS